MQHPLRHTERPSTPDKSGREDPGRVGRRMFLPHQPVPRELVDEALALAVRAPSNTNIQPWHMCSRPAPPWIRLLSRQRYLMDNDDYPSEPRNMMADSAIDDMLSVETSPWRIDLGQSGTGRDETGATNSAGRDETRAVDSHVSRTPAGIGQLACFRGSDSAGRRRGS
jgi:hypothetical protein